MSNQNVDAVLDRVLAEVDQWAAVRRPAGEFRNVSWHAPDGVDVVDDGLSRSAASSRPGSSPASASPVPKSSAFAQQALSSISVCRC